MKKILKAFTAVLSAVISASCLAACGAGGGSSLPSTPSDDPPSTQTPAEPTEPDAPGTPSTPVEPDTPAVPSEPDTPADAGSAKVLIAYFTWSNNTTRMASYIHEQVGGTLYEIVPAVPYPTDYSECTTVAREERDNDARPAIKGPLSSEAVAEYDTILVGFPVWWHTAPMIIGTFLESYEWSADVDIYPFFQGAVNTSTEYYDNSMAFVAAVP